MKIEDLMSPFGFSFGVLQDISTLLTIFAANNITAKDFADYLEQLKQDHLRLQKEWKAKQSKCPKCGAILQITSINTAPQNQTGDDSKSLWFCTKCDYEKYNKETIAVIYKRKKKE